MEKPQAETVDERFFAPLENAFETATKTRKCHEYPDRDFLRAGVGRCLHNVASGRAWVQRLRSVFGIEVGIAPFFTALRSERRLELVTEMNEALIAQCALDPVADCFAPHAELDGFAVYAGDGHYHGCSAHEEPLLGKRRPPGHFFSLNLRTRALRHLEIVRRDAAAKRKGEHDMHVLKRLPPKALRMNEPTGTRVLICYDPAAIDFEQWYKWKQGSGIYILTREKKNMALQVLGNRDFDRGDPRNRGVLADELAGHSKGRAIRRVTYQAPKGDIFHFITNEMTLPPGLIAYIHKCRWDIEKVFDELKNHLDEKKAWGKTDAAKMSQGNFFCLNHNLMVLLENQLEVEEGIRDEKLLRRRAAAFAEEAASAEAAGRPVSSLLATVLRATQRSLQFLRWLRDALLLKTRWRPALARLRPLMHHYLQ